MINQYKCPKDKILTIINFCNIITTMLMNHSKNKNEKDKNNKTFAGADDVMPIVVYAIIKGNIPKIKSNINYIKLFRHHTMFDSNKEEYFTTVLDSGISFIEKLSYDSNDIKINKEEIEFILKNKKEKELIIPKQNSKNIDENFLIYYLTDNEENSSSKKITSNNNDNIELTNLINKNLNTITESTIDKSLLKEKYPINKIDFKKLYSEYFSKELKDLSIYQLEKMTNDFKILMFLISLNQTKTIELKKK
jgi:hypothetical protein